MPTATHTESLARDARAALWEIEGASWGERFFPGERLRAWFRAIDDPACLLDTLRDMPQTLIHGDCPGALRPGSITMRQNERTYFDWQMVGAGPAPYDLACLHSSARWRFGRIPLSIAEMRSQYLKRLNERLGERVDRYIFDAGVDAARAWRFALLWPQAIVENHVSLLANLRHLQNTVMEPAFASLSRSMN